ncbi:MAG: hypothetical protein V2A73_01130 [Pseudomonadota bacterium]
MSEANQGNSETTGGGFRLKTEPKIQTIFGDTAQYKRYVERFFTVYGEMQKSHADFSRNVQVILASLEAQASAGEAPHCPTEAIALAYATAFKQGRAYHTLGKELEALYSAIRDLDEAAETKGLTPDYRWKVGRALKLYATVLVDFREMKAFFESQLASELAFYGCDQQRLLAIGEEKQKPQTQQPASTVATNATGGNPGNKRKGKDKDVQITPPIPASTATFLVDNSSCPATLTVYLDGSLLGDVDAHAKAAFRSLVGYHDLCLISSSTAQECGEQGTVRRAYLHDGWSISIRCD